MSGYGMSGGGLFMVLWWVLVAVGIVVLIKWLVQSSGSKTVREENQALNLLKERYARGEIDDEEFQARKRKLDE